MRWCCPLRPVSTPAAPVRCLAFAGKRSRCSRDYYIQLATGRSKGSARKLFHHSATGPLPLHQHVLMLPQCPGTQLWVYQAEPHSGAEAQLDRLRELTP